MNTIAQGDVMKLVEIEGDVTSLFADMQSKLDEWNGVLDQG